MMVRRAPLFPLTEAGPVSLFIQSIAFGIHLVVFAICIHRWLRRSRLPGFHMKPWPWVVIAITLFTIGMVDVFLNLHNNLVASNTVFNVVRTVLCFTNGLVSDAALIYRCWIVYANWRPRWAVVLVPSLLWLGSAISAIIDVYLMSTLHNNTPIPSDKSLRPYLFAAYIMSLLLNITVTSLIVYRMWKMNKQASSFTRQLRLNGTERLKAINRIFIESALLYTLSIAISVIMEIICNNALYATTGASVEIAGITFDLIIIRTWTGPPPPSRPSAIYQETESLRPASPYRLPNLDFLNDDPFSKLPLGRSSYCPSEQGSLFTNDSRFTTKTAVRELRSLGYGSTPRPCRY